MIMVTVIIIRADSPVNGNLNEKCSAFHFFGDKVKFIEEENEKVPLILDKEDYSVKQYRIWRLK